MGAKLKQTVRALGRKSRAVVERGLARGAACGLFHSSDLAQLRSARLARLRSSCQGDFAIEEFVKAPGNRAALVPVSLSTKEVQRLPDEHVVILKDAAMTGVGENAQLRVGQVTRQLE